MSFKVKFLFLVSTLLMSSLSAEAESFYKQKKTFCAVIMKKIEGNLSKITDRDRIKDNKYMIKASLWAVSYQQYSCDPEPYLNSLRRNLNRRSSSSLDSCKK